MDSSGADALTKTPVPESQGTLLHNKPKKAKSTGIVPEDYICSNNDLDIINRIKKIPTDPGREEVVLIGDAVVHRYGMECLFNEEDFLNDEYI
ncbi:hypothetical protein ACP4OV_019096 [Aristida adscensionis]